MHKAIISRCKYRHDAAGPGFKKTNHRLLIGYTIPDGPIEPKMSHYGAVQRQRDCGRRDRPDRNSRCPFQQATEAVAYMTPVIVVAIELRSDRLGPETLLLVPS